MIKDTIKDTELYQMVKRLQDIEHQLIELTWQRDVLRNEINSKMAKLTVEEPQEDIER
jgi:flagellar biosynthesis chaperone FliJ